MPSPRSEPRRRRLPLALALLAGLSTGVLASGTAGASASPRTHTLAVVADPCGKAGPAPATYDHVIWIWMENHRADQVVGRSSSPFVTGLVRRCGTAAQYQKVGSPSLPNYLGATSGDTWGVHDDAAPAAHPLTADNLFRQVRVAGGQERSYQEAMVQPCRRTPRGRYAVKHDPAAYYVGADDAAACNADVVSLGSVASGALARAIDTDRLPAFSFVTPDLCHDTHDCTVATGDRWLKQWVNRLLASRAYRAGRTAIFLVWDEPTPMPFVVIAPTVPRGAVAPGTTDHYALLRTTEELLGLPLLGHATTAPTLRPSLSF